MTNNYIIGCNYWDSEHGTNMWRDWDQSVVEKDLAALAEIGVKWMRVFPNWRDFQPVIALRGAKGVMREYRLTGERLPENEFYIDPTMIERFLTFCDIAQKNGIKFIVSIVTGWMSGRYFCPPVLEEKNAFNNFEALMFQDKFVRGFVRMTKHHPAIGWWDLGNESNNMAQANSRFEAYNWTAMIRNAILAEDQTRGIMSGMHGLDVVNDPHWKVADQGALTDVLTPHPYPSNTTGATIEPANRLRSTMVSTSYCEFYSGVGGKPAMMQEQGTFCDLTIDREGAADFMRVNVCSGWANGSIGYLWWCGNEHRLLNHTPYTWSMWERELGLLDENFVPKPVGREMKRLSDLFETLPDLPAKTIDACCIITDGNNKWQTSSNCFLLGKQAGLEITLRYFKQELPDVPVYFLPAVSGTEPIYKEQLMFLIDKVKNGATLYMSMGDAYFTDFEYIFGLRSHGFTGPARSVASLELADGNLTLAAEYAKTFAFEPLDCQVIGSDTEGRPAFTCHRLGKGKVYFLAFPLEQSLAGRPMCYCNDNALPYWRIYREVAREIIEAKACISENPQVAVTLHPESETSMLAVAVNYSDREQEAMLRIADGWKCEYIYGSNAIAKCDMAVLRLTK